MDSAAKRSAFEVYESSGNSEAALKLLLSEKKAEKSNKQKYNEFLCQSLASQRQLDDAWFNELMVIEEAVKDQHNQTTETTLNRITQWIAVHNRGLALLNLHRPREAWDIVWPIWKGEMMPIVNKNIKANSKESSTVSFRVVCRTGLLLLQASLEPNFRQPVDNIEEELVSTSLLLDWLQSNIPTEQASLKFLHLLVKSQMNLSNAGDNLSLTDDQVRSARKELKNAMDIFQHKLKDDETATVSSVLNLKANTERLKGNVKKSLILLGEAKTDDDGKNDQMKSLDDQMHHYNNLGLVYRSNENPNLALHAWSKSLTTNSKLTTTATLQTKGTAQSNGQTMTLFNASMTCLQQQNFKTAYECMSQVIPMWPLREDCWLRLAEACIGLHHLQSQQNKGIDFETAIDNQGNNAGLVVQSHRSSVATQFTLALVLGGPQDMEQLEQNPLPRAKACLQQCLLLLSDKKTKKTKRQELMFLSGNLSMSYICLEEENYPKALEYAVLVLDGTKNHSALSTFDSSNSSDFLLESTVKRQMATARMYAAEASCTMGDVAQSMKYLLGNNENNDAIDKLASDLAGLTVEVASNHPLGKARLAKAQAMVRCNASAVTAKLNHLAVAKQLAMSAQAMEGAYLSTAQTEESFARRVLLYYMLREGNSTSALTLLRSFR